MAPRLRSASALHNALPEPVFRAIMLALPVDARGQAACVCRSWRAYLADPSLWQVLDLTSAGGLAAERLTLNLIRGAVARAAGQLRIFSLNEVPDVDDLNVRELLVAVIQSDGAELQQVNTDVSLTVAQLEAVFAAAPRLQVLNAPVMGKCTALLPVVRKDAPYGPLRVSQLHVWFAGDTFAEADVLALAAAVALHESLTGLSVSNANFSRGVNALVDAAAERRVARLSIFLTSSNVQDTTAFGRKLGALLAANLPSLRTLNVNDCRLGDEGLAPVLDGVAANTHLRILRCGGNDLSEAFERDRLLPVLAALEARANLAA